MTDIEFKYTQYLLRMFEESEGVTRSHNFKNRQYNGQKKKEKRHIIDNIIVH
jgi:hypothetical protein